MSFGRQKDRACSRGATGLAVGCGDGCFGFDSGEGHDLGVGGLGLGEPTVGEVIHAFRENQCEPESVAATPDEFQSAVAHIIHAGVGREHVVVEFHDSSPIELAKGAEHLHVFQKTFRAGQRREIVVELARDLVAVVEEGELLHVDEEAYAGDRVQERHLLVLEKLRVDAPEGWVVQAVGKGGSVAGGREVHVAPGFVGLGFDRAADIVIEPLFDDVPGDAVEALCDPLVGFLGNAGGDLESVAGHPVGEVASAEQLADAESSLDLLPGQLADLGIGVCQAAVAKQGVSVEVAGNHVEAHEVRVQIHLDLPQLFRGRGGDFLGIGGVPEHEVVIVCGGQFDQSLVGRSADDVADPDGGDARENGAAEWIADGIGHAPEGH